MSPRPHNARLLHDLKETRDELLGELDRLPADQLDWAPAEGMKSYKDMLRECAAMEAECVSLASTGVVPAWEDAVAWIGGDLASTIADLGRVRVATIAYLEGCTEEKLQQPIPLPEDWKQYFPVPDIEPEELLRWIVRHEYYHLGQIITYRWIQGDNPYKRGRPHV